MMVTSYIPVFKVQVSNGYYKGASDDSLFYTPSADTQTLLTAFSMRYTTTPNGFIFYIAAEESIAKFLNYIEKVRNISFFSFTGTAVNADFYQFTDLPLNKTGTVGFDTENAQNNKTADGLSLLGVFSPSTTAPYVFELKVRFKTLIDYQKTNTVPNFNITFMARKTQLRYFIIDNYGYDPTNLSITGAPNFEFNKPEEVTLPNGQQATLFSSGSAKIALSAVPTFQLDLMYTSTKNGTTRKTTVLKGLPNPNPETMAVYSEDGKDYAASLIYVYL